MIKVAIADDNFYLIQALKEKLSFFDDVVCGITAANGKDLLGKLNESSRPDVILMDVEMPVMDGIEATQLLKQKFPQIKVIMLTVFDNYDKIAGAIKAGADGYLLKDIAPDELYRSIVETFNGGASLTPSVALKTMKMLRDPDAFSTTPTENPDLLSARELDVLRQLATGLKYNQIAENLFLSVGTVRKHVENIYTKLQVHNKLEAIQKSRQLQLL